MRTLTIRIPEAGDPRCGFDVVDSEGRHANGLAWDEFIGQVVALTHPKLGSPQYRMQADEQWATESFDREARAAQTRAARAEAPQLMLDALRQWRQAEQTDDPREYENAQRARDEAIAKATAT